MNIEDLKAGGRRLRKQIAQAKEALTKLNAELGKLQAQIPNMSHPDAPVGTRLPGGPDGEVRF